MEKHQTVCECGGEINMNSDEPGVPYTQADAVAEHVERIKLIYRDGDGYMSTSQQIMVGLALCRPDLLEAARYPASDIKAAWVRLDDSQRQAIIAWWESNQGLIMVFGVKHALLFLAGLVIVAVATPPADAGSQVLTVLAKKKKKKPKTPLKPAPKTTPIRNDKNQGG